VDVNFPGRRNVEVPQVALQLRVGSLQVKEGLVGRGGEAAGRVREDRRREREPTCTFMHTLSRRAAGERATAHAHRCQAAQI
jgi:hypothetical protein